MKTRTGTSKLHPAAQARPKPEQCGESPERDNYFIGGSAPDFNDYFILFGGRVSVVAS